MRSFAVLTNPIEDPRLDLTACDRDAIRMLVADRGIIYCQSRGLWAKVPNAVLADALSGIEDWGAFKQRHTEAVMPADIGVITWGQTVTPRDLSAIERAPLLPLRQPSSHPPEARRSE